MLILYFEHNKFCWVSKFRESFNILDRIAIEWCNRKWILTCTFSRFLFFLFFYTYINLESEQNQLLNFIIIYQCRSVLFYRIWKFKKIIWNYFMRTYISNFHQYILFCFYVLQIFNLHFIFDLLLPFISDWNHS